MRFKFMCQVLDSSEVRGRIRIRKFHTPLLLQDDRKSITVFLGTFIRPTAKTKYITHITPFPICNFMPGY